MSLETPVISSNTSDIENQISAEFINLIEPENVNELYIKIVERYMQYEQYNAKAVRGKAVILKQFESGICAGKLEEVLTEVNRISN